jgi:hypothetical protein
MNREINRTGWKKNHVNFSVCGYGLFTFDNRDIKLDKCGNFGKWLLFKPNKFIENSNVEIQS